LIFQCTLIFRHTISFLLLSFYSLLSSYYRGWIQRVVEERYDGGVCSLTRLLDSPLRCPRGTWGDAEGADPLVGLTGSGGPLSSLASFSRPLAGEASSSSVVVDADMETGDYGTIRTIHSAPGLTTSSIWFVFFFLLVSSCFFFFLLVSSSFFLFLLYFKKELFSTITADIPLLLLFCSSRSLRLFPFLNVQSSVSKREVWCYRGFGGLGLQWRL
jgi:hypothetical protein